MVSEVNQVSAALAASPPPLGPPISAPITTPITTGRHLITVAPPGLPEPLERPARPAAREAEGDTPIPGLDVRNASPRQISNVSLDLYAAGLLTYEDYTALAFQPELHPDYNRTVGALTGERAQPDRRRDFVNYWNERLQFELRHNPHDSPVVRQTGRIHDLLKGLARRMRMDA